MDLIFNMSILNLDMFVVSFDMFLLIYYQSDLNFDQFDLNFGQVIYSYSGQFASTATTASSSSSRNFLCRLQLRGDSWGVAIRLGACIFILPGGMAQVSAFLRPSLAFGWRPLSFLSVYFFSVWLVWQLPVDLCASIPIEGGVVLYT